MTSLAEKYKPYPAYKPFDVEWLGDIPAHWEVRRLKYLATVNDEALPETTDPGIEIAYVDIGNVDSVGGITGTEELVFEGAPSRARRIVRQGDVIISTVRTYLKAIARIEPTDANLIVSTGFAVIRPRKVDDGFVAYALSSPYFVDRVVAHSVGVSYPAINASELACLDIVFPPLPEQQAIAAFLDRETARIDALVSRKERLIELLQEKRAALITRAVTRGLDSNAPLKDSGVEWLREIPAHWEVKRLAWLTECLDSQRVPLNGQERSEMTGDYPYWGANSIVDYIDGWIFDEELVLVGEDGAPFLDRDREVAFTVSGKIWVNNHAHVLRPGPQIFSKFLSSVLNCVDYRAFIDGTTRDKLTQSDMNTISIQLPSISEQQTIISFLDRETAKLDGLIVKVQEAILRLRELRTALISAAVTGRIDVRGEAGCT